MEAVPKELRIPDPTLPEPLPRPRSQPRTGDQVYRLKYLNSIEKELKKDLRMTESTIKKYKKANNTIFYFDGFLTSATIIIGGVAVGTTATVVGASLGLPALVIAITTGSVSGLCKMFSNRFRRKIEKHKKLQTLTASKLSSLRLMVSKALDASHGPSANDIDEKEFETILQSYKQYERLKLKIKKKESIIEDSFTIAEGKKRDSRIIKLTKDIENMLNVFKRETTMTPGRSELEPSPLK